MPSGYTAILGEKEDMTLKEFALLCARAFGACVDMRDEPLSTPIPEKFECDTFYQKKYEEAKKVLDDFMALEDKVGYLEKTYDKYFDDEHKRHIQKSEEKAKLRDRYSRMLFKVIKWTPPTKEHDDLRNFMIKQIHDSIEWDCSEYPLNLCSKEEWCNVERKIKNFQKDVDYYHQEMIKEKERYDSRNKWIKDLRDSLEGL